MASLTQRGADASFEMDDSRHIPFFIIGDDVAKKEEQPISAERSDFGRIRSYDVVFSKEQRHSKIPTRRHSTPLEFSRVSTYQPVGNNK
jgi:hypothetical protein